MYDFYNDMRYREALMQEKRQQADMERLRAAARGRGAGIHAATVIRPLGSWLLSFNLGRVVVRISAV